MPVAMMATEDRLDRQVEDVARREEAPVRHEVEDQTERDECADHAEQAGVHLERGEQGLLLLRGGGVSRGGGPSARPSDEGGRSRGGSGALAVSRGRPSSAAVGVRSVAGRGPFSTPWQSASFAIQPASTYDVEVVARGGGSAWAPPRNFAPQRRAGRRGPLLRALDPRHLGGRRPEATAISPASRPRSRGVASRRRRSACPWRRGSARLWSPSWPETRNGALEALRGERGDGAAGRARRSRRRPRRPRCSAR